MDIKPIRSEAEYEAALAEIETLWGAPHGSPEEDRLDVLVTFVEAHEERHYPILPSNPIKTILHQNDTLYLLNIPGMREAIIEGLNIPTDECTDEVEW